MSIINIKYYISRIVANRVYFYRFLKIVKKKYIENS